MPLVAGTALTQGTPDATLVFTGGSVAAGIGFGWGSGTPTVQEKECPSSVEGVSVGSVGASKVSARGGVYILKALEGQQNIVREVGAVATDHLPDDRVESSRQRRRQGWTSHASLTF